MKKILLSAFKWTDKKFGGLDILVNNAGVAFVAPIIDSKTEEYRRVIDTNLIAPAIFAREAVKAMKKCNAYGHIINISRRPRPPRRERRVVSDSYRLKPLRWSS
ncbi:farnesol dehydrogenase-like isoform X1 [Bombus vancouverensis nearcticus]|uniref:farnesol dehydrogenase-like isoform X1 n=1 Tax=Bombus vancouverensis nearcticus TaxID=2705178 RepID=UPI00402B5850